ncbi:SNF2 superfamily protein, partial [Laccaria bicolor S238N-H82]
MATNVVGIQYYKGLVGPGEEVLLVREPNNPYDRNAIQVKNIGHVQVGHLPRNVASKLATLMDRQLVTVEGWRVLADVYQKVSGSRGYTLSLRLKIFGPSDKRNSLEPLLGWATPGQRGFPSRQTATSTPVVPASVGRTPSAAKAAELRQMLSSLEKVDDEGRRGSLLDTLCSTDDVLSLPLHPNPPSLETGELTVNLMRHQATLQWCIERENPVLPKKEGDKPVQFWQLRKNGSSSYYYNIATKTPQTAPPALGRGALCADAMARFYLSGKTLTMISLIIATKKDNNPVEMFYCSSLMFPAVAPLSVLSNWDKQIKDHCTPGTLSTCVYYDTNRSMSSAELHKFDVVITTYQIVAGEHADATNTVAHSKKKKKLDRSLFEVNWKRIILDEGHVIRNPKTKMARAVVALNADRRWVLTGTPIINSPRDLGSLLTFLQICRPLDNEDFYKRLLLRPLKNGEAAGVELLRALMSHICIRRTKEMQDANGLPLIPLPPVEMIKVPVALNEEARRLYDEVQRVSQQRFENFINRGANAVQSNVLSMLTRMRQIALHPGLVPQNYLEELRNAEGNDGTHIHGKPLSPEEKLRLQEQLGQAIEDCEECPICFSVLDDARITNCAHMFCFPCITEVISRDPKCPMDRRPLTLGDLYERLPPTDLTQKPNPVGIRAGSSAKIDQLIHLLKLTPTNEKSLVFSQFTSFLDKIAETMDEEGIPYVRFDGQMSAKRRQETLASFSEKGNRRPRSGLASKRNPRVMLISLKAGALGLNLTGKFANNVYLMDPWWQEGIESQAVDRVNRIGQKKNVHVYQLIAEDTVESKVLEIQERKKQLI